MVYVGQQCWLIITHLHQHLFFIHKVEYGHLKLFLGYIEKSQ